MAIWVASTPVTSLATTPPMGSPPRRRELLSIKNAERLGVSPNRIRKYRDQGKIRGIRVGEKPIKYAPEDLDRFTSEFNN